MKRAAALLALLLAIAAKPIAADPVLGTGHGLDHVLLWTRDADTATAALRDKIGFDVRAGGDFGNGMANRLIRFPDGAFLEQLFLTRPGGQLDGDAADAFDFLRRGPGADTFALETSDMDATALALRGRNLDLYPETPSVFDPDGDGPKPPQHGLFRTLFLQERALRSAEIFYVSYRGPRPAASVHPNTASGLTAIWLVTPDLAGDAGRLEQMGLRKQRTIALPPLAARGIVFAAGGGHVVLVQPDGRGGRAADALRRHPGRIFAISIAVLDLDTARRRLEQGYRTRIRPYRGLWGKAFEAPTQADLGTHDRISRFTLSA